LSGSCQFLQVFVKDCVHTVKLVQCVEIGFMTEVIGIIVNNSVQCVSDTLLKPTKVK